MLGESVEVNETGKIILSIICDRTEKGSNSSEVKGYDFVFKDLSCSGWANVRSKVHDL